MPVDHFFVCCNRRRVNLKGLPNHTFVDSPTSLQLDVETLGGTCGSRPAHWHVVVLMLGHERPLSHDPTSFAAPARMQMSDGLRRLAESERVCHRVNISVMLISMDESRSEHDVLQYTRCMRATERKLLRGSRLSKHYSVTLEPASSHKSRSC